MATFTSVPLATSSQFRHYDPTSLKPTKAKAKAKATGHTEEPAYNLGLQDKDIRGEPYAVPRQTPQVQATGHIADVEEIDSAMCGLFGADHGTNMYDLASGNSHYQFGCELLDKGGIDHVTCVTISDSSTNESFDRGNRDFHLVEEGSTTEEHHSATHFQPNNRVSDYHEEGYHPIAAHEGGHVRQRGDLDAAVEPAFSVGDMESSCQERSLAENETFFSIVSGTNAPSVTCERSRRSSVVDATTITSAAIPDVIPDLETEDTHPAKRQRLAERQAQSPILEPTSTPKSTSPLKPSGQASRPRASDGPISGRLGASHKGDGAVSLVLPPSDPRDREHDHDAHVQGTVDKLLQSRRSISPFEGIVGEQDVIRESFKDEISHNNEVLDIPPANTQLRVGRDSAPKRKRGLSNTALRPLDCNTVPARAQQQLRPSQPRQNSMPGRPRINKRPRSCSPQSSPPGRTAGDGTSINHGPSLDKTCQITDLTLCAIPNGSSIVTAIVRYRDSNWSLDPIALGNRFLGEHGKVIRMTQLSPSSWMLLGYRCDDSALDLCDRRGLNSELISSSHSDTSSHGTDDSDNDSDEEGENEEEVIKECSRRTHKPWLESDEARLLSLKDKQGMEWQEICERFPDRSPGAVKLRYYTLRKKDL